MTPGVDRDLVPVHVLALEYGREGNSPRTNDKESGLEAILIEVIQEVGGVVGGTVVVSKTPGVLCGTISDISRTNTSTTCPPTARSVCSSLSIVGASSGLNDRKAWDLNAGRFHLGNPLLDLWAVCGRNRIQLRVICRTDG